MRPILILLSLFVGSLAFAQGSSTQTDSAPKGSGSKASQSLLTLDTPIDACLLAGAELWSDLDLDAQTDGEAMTQAADLLIDTPTPTQIVAVTFDQTWVEVGLGEQYYFVLSNQVNAEVCPS